jgi:hypothetical protein
MKITNVCVDLTAKFIEKMISLTTTIFFYIYVFYNVLIGNMNIYRFLGINILFLLLLKILMCFLKYIRCRFLLCQYTIYYYLKNSPEEMTDMEIIDTILNKCFFDDEIDKKQEQKLTINIKRGDFNDNFLEHIKLMKEKTLERNENEYLKQKKTQVKINLREDKIFSYFFY